MARVNKTTGVLLLLGVAVLLMSAGAAWFMENRNPPAAGDTRVDVKAEADTPVNVFSTGRVDVRSRLSNPMPGVPGVVAAIEVEELQKVEPGQVLLRLDDTAARTEVEKLKSQLELAKREVPKAQLAVDKHKAEINGQKRKVAKAKNDLDFAKVVLRRAEGLKDVDARGDELVKKAATDVANATEQYLGEREFQDFLEKSVPTALVDLANQAVTELEKQVARAEKSLDSYVVKAPKAGWVFRLNVSVGDAVGAGVPNVAPPLVFCPDEPLIVRAEINQEYAGKVRVGDEVRLGLGGDKDTARWKGTVESLSPWVARPRSTVIEPDSYPDVRNRECVIRLEGSAKDLAELVIGTKVTVEIVKK